MWVPKKKKKKIPDFGKKEEGLINGKQTTEPAVQSKKNLSHHMFCLHMLLIVALKYNTLSCRVSVTNNAVGTIWT